jgi:hypothetical protein
MAEMMYDGYQPRPGFGRRGGDPFLAGNVLGLSRLEALDRICSNHVNRQRGSGQPESDQPFDAPGTNDTPGLGRGLGRRPGCSPLPVRVAEGQDRSGRGSNTRGFGFNELDGIHRDHRIMPGNNPHRPDHPGTPFRFGDIDQKVRSTASLLRRKRVPNRPETPNNNNIQTQTGTPQTHTEAPERQTISGSRDLPRIHRSLRIHGGSSRFQSVGSFSRSNHYSSPGLASNKRPTISNDFLGLSRTSSPEMATADSMTEQDMRDLRRASEQQNTVTRQPENRHRDTSVDLEDCQCRIVNLYAQCSDDDEES